MNQEPIVLSPAASKGCLALFSLLILCFLLPFFGPALVIVTGEILVYAQADTAEATVIEVTPSNKKCVEGISVDCTHFSAQVVFYTPTEAITATLDMGHVLGYNQPVSQADYPPGTTFSIRYNPRNPSQVSYDSLGAIFSLDLVMITLFPLLILVVFLLFIILRVKQIFNHAVKRAKLRNF